jgi:hypothetical protein
MLVSPLSPAPEPVARPPFVAASVGTPFRPPIA